MSLLGKILAIFCVLQAIVLAVLIAMDWGQRQRWAYASYRYDLLLEGLPIDEKERDADNTLRVDRLSNQTLNDLFQGAGTPLRTQVEVVDDVRRTLQQMIDNPEVKGTKEQKLCRILLPFARTFGERDALLARIRQPKEENTEELEKTLGAPFEVVRDPNRALDERKRMAAHILFCTAEVFAEAQPAEGEAAGDFLTGTAYRRMVATVGLSAAIRELESEAVILTRVAAEAEEALKRDRGRFIDEHGRRIYAVMTLAEELQKQVAFLQTKRDEVTRQEELVKTRQLELDRLTLELTEARRTTQQRLEEQDRLEKEIFDRVRKMRDRMQENSELERQIRELEGLGKQP
jgi:hypothetical protein